LRLRRATASEWIGPCPICNGLDRFGINIRKSIFNCRGCSKGGDVVALVQYVQGVGFRDAIEYLLGEQLRDLRPELQVVAGAVHHVNGEDQDAARRTEQALKIWSESVEPFGTPVELYLATRALLLPAEAAGDALRFHPACPFAGEKTPAMIALVRDVVDDRPIAIHRTALTPDGNKAVIKGNSRLSLGPIAGGAIKLSPDAHVTICLGIAEGIETALSMREIAEFGPSPVWALISAGGLAAFPILSAIESLFIAVDADEAGRRASAAVGARWRRAGREAFLIEPRRPGLDLNDLVRRARH
jgi:putative DNA primase/helicase